MAGRNWTLLVAFAAGLAWGGGAMAQPLEPEAIKFHDERLQPGLYPGDPGFEVPEEPGHPPFAVDWSLGLKGSYTSSSSQGGSFVNTLHPAFSAVHDGRRLDLTLDGEAEIARPLEDNGAITVTGLRLGLGGNAPLDRDTRLSGNAALSLSQDLPGSPGLNPALVIAPQVLKGSAGLGLERRFGKFNLGLKGDIARTFYGPSTRTDSGLTDNREQNLWQADISLRAGLQVTPILEIFGEASLGRDMFDGAAAGQVQADATSRALRGGIAGHWNGVWSASASIGLGQHDFDAASLSDITTRLYDASLTYSPDATLDVTARLATNVEPVGPDANGTARVSHIASANLAYRVNSWLRLRASADWGLSHLEGSGESERQSGIGAGADYALSAHSALSADYGYEHRDNSATGALDIHKVSVGVTIRR